LQTTVLICGRQSRHRRVRPGRRHNEHHRELFQPSKAWYQWRISPRQLATSEAVRCRAWFPV